MDAAITAAERRVFNLGDILTSDLNLRQRQQRNKFYCHCCGSDVSATDIRDSGQIGSVLRCRACIIAVDPRYAVVW